MGGGVSGFVSIGGQYINSFLSRIKTVFCGGGQGLFTGCVGKNVGMLGKGGGGGGCDVLVCHRTIEFRL